MSDTTNAPPSAGNGTSGKAPSGASDAAPAPVMPGSRLRKHWPKVAAYLAAGFTLTETATRTNVSRKAIKEWKKHPDFQSLLDLAQVEYAKEAVKAQVKAVVREQLKEGALPPAAPEEPDVPAYDGPARDAGAEFGF